MLSHSSRRSFLASVPMVLLSGCLSQMSENRESETEECNISRGYYQGNGEPVSRTVELSHDEIGEDRCGQEAARIALQSLAERMDVELVGKRWITAYHSMDRDDVWIAVMPAHDTENQKRCPPQEFELETARTLLPSRVTVRLETVETDEAAHECTYRDVYVSVDQ